MSELSLVHQAMQITRSRVLADAAECPEGPRATPKAALKALKTHPEAFWAYCTLADAVDTIEEKVFFYQRGIAAGQMCLGDGGLAAGNLWDNVAYRDYIRLRYAHANDLWLHGHKEKAADELTTTLNLAGPRFGGLAPRLVSWLTSLGRPNDSASVAWRYLRDAEDSAINEYARALAVFYCDPPEFPLQVSQRITDAFASAFKANKYVPEFLASDLRPEGVEDGNFKPRSRAEAQFIASELFDGWNSHPLILRILTRELSNWKDEAGVA